MASQAGARLATEAPAESVTDEVVTDVAVVETETTETVARGCLVRFARDRKKK